jgi:hypothetical protein
MIITAAKIVRQRRRLVAAGKHHRHDQRHLDHRDRDRQHQRAERLADLVRDDLGVMDGGDHGGHERQCTDDR